jgi:hypothetical protein
MPIYDQQTTLSTGRFAPSVNYNAAIRIPTQPMPDLPDVNASFNIDLRPIGEAVIAGKELEWKSIEADKDRVEKRLQQQDQFEHEFALKEMELESIEARAAEQRKIDWYNARTNRKLAEKEDKKNEKDTLTTAAINYVVEETQKLQADIQAKKVVGTNAIRLRENKILDGLQSLFPAVDSSHVVKETRNVFPNALTSLDTLGSVTIKAEKDAETDRVKKEYEAGAVTAELYGTTTEQGVALNKRTIEAVERIPQIQEALKNPDLSGEEKKLLEQELNTNLEFIGGGAAYSALINHLPDLVNSNNPDEALKNMMDAYVASVSPFMSQSQAMNNFKLFDDKYQLSKNVKYVTDMDENILKNYEREVKLIVKRGDFHLLQNNDFVRTFAVMNDIDNKLGQAFLDTGHGDVLVDSMASGSIPTVERKETGYVDIKLGGNTISLSPDKVRDLESRSGMKIEDMLDKAYVSSALKAVSEGNKSGVQMLNTYTDSKSGTDKDITNSSNNITNINKNSTTVADILDVCKNNPNERSCKVMSANLSISSYFNNDPVKLAELKQRIHRMRPSEIAGGWFKGGAIGIYPQKNGTIDLFRHTTGAFGGLGNIETQIDMAAVEAVLNDIPNMPIEQKVAFLEAELGQEHFILHATGENVPLTSHLKEEFKKLLTSGLDIFGAADTLYATFLERPWELGYAPKENARQSSANAELRVQPVVPPTASMTDFDKYPPAKNKDGSVSNVGTEIVSKDGVEYVVSTTGDTSKHFGGYANRDDAMKAIKQMHKERDDQAAVRDQSPESDVGPRSKKPETPVDGKLYHSVIGDQNFISYRKKDAGIEYDYNTETKQETFKVDDVMYNGSIPLIGTEFKGVEIVESIDGGVLLVPTNKGLQGTYGWYPDGYAEKMKKAIETFYGIRNDQ